MLKLKFKRKKSHCESGFTLLEVLVGILLITAFTLIGLQAIVISTILRVKALQISEANNLIREDFEEVKYQATNYYPVNRDALCAATTATTGFAYSFQQFVGGTTTKTKSSASLNRNYVLTRTTQVMDASLGGTAPFNTLKVIYKVALEESPTSVLAYTQAEVIPESAFNCKYY